MTEDKVLDELSEARKLLSLLQTSLSTVSTATRMKGLTCRLVCGGHISDMPLESKGYFITRINEISRKILELEKIIWMMSQTEADDIISFHARERDLFDV